MNPFQTERSKAAIATTQIIKRLNKFVMGDEKVIMSPAQVTAAIALLKKTIPDLQNIEANTNVTITQHDEAVREIEALISTVEPHGLPH